MKNPAPKILLLKKKLEETMEKFPKAKYTIQVQGNKIKLVINVQNKRSVQ